MGSAKAKNAPAAQIAVARAMVVGAVAAAAFSWTEGRAQSPGASVVVVKAVKGCFVSAVRFTGLVVPRAEAIVNLDAEGYQISEILVTEGDIVTTGQVLARMTRLAAALHDHGAKSDLMESRAAFAEKRKPRFKGWNDPKDRYRTPTLETLNDQG